MDLIIAHLLYRCPSLHHRPTLASALLGPAGDPMPWPVHTSQPAHTGQPYMLPFRA
uniref:Uncharacterized protein n=1 Tax=Saimiri boliviensis boliviensis TaxID=39432 RepID=A0A2K6SPR9_SAIBB